MNSLGMRIFFLVFFVVGMGMATVDFFLFKDRREALLDAVLTQGEVTGFVQSRGSKGGSMYAPRVRFSVPMAEGGAGESFEIVGRVRSSNKGYAIGDTVPVIYKPEDPASARLHSFMEQWFAILIVSVFVLVLNGIWITFAVLALRRRRMDAWLDQYGSTVQARVQQIKQRTNVRVNRRHPWQISALWTHPVTRTAHTFTSDSVWENPTMAMRGVKEIDVRVDMDDPRRYRMDLSFLG